MQTQPDYFYHFLAWGYDLSLTFGGGKGTVVHSVNSIGHLVLSGWTRRGYSCHSYGVNSSALRFTRPWQTPFTMWLPLVGNEASLLYSLPRRLAKSSRYASALAPTLC